jgi:hypothetical protein
VRCKFTDVSEEHSAFIFRVDKKTQANNHHDAGSKRRHQVQHKYFFAQFPYFEKNESRLMLSPCCLCLYVPHFINFWMAELTFMKLRMYIMTTEPISAAYFINPFHQSVCISPYSR